MTNKVFGILKMNSRLITAADGSQLLCGEIVNDNGEIETHATYMRSGENEPLISINYNELMAEIYRMSKLSSGGKMEEATGFMGAFTDGRPAFIMLGVIDSCNAQFYQLSPTLDNLGREVFCLINDRGERESLLAELIDYSNS